MATIGYIPSWQQGVNQQLQTFGQIPTAMNGSIMAGYNPNITDPSSGLTPAFADPIGILGSGTAAYGMSTGDISKQVASAPWGGMPQAAGSGFRMNMPTFALGLQGLNSLGSLYMGAKSLSLANKQFESAQKFANINLKNQTQSYNDTLESKLRRIGSFNETPKEQTDAEIERRKLPTYS